jgi:hypothetical protein
MHGFHGNNNVIPQIAACLAGTISLLVILREPFTTHQSFADGLFDGDAHLTLLRDSSGQMGDARSLSEMPTFEELAIDASQRGL